MRLNGFPLAAAKDALSEIVAVPENSYADFIDSKKQEIVNFHLQHNSFYRNLNKDAFTSWNDVPVMTKSDYQRPLRERLSDGFSDKDVYVNKTSGSGGHPMVFAKDKMCHAMIWANIARKFAWYQIDLNTSLQARFYGRPLEFLADKKLRFKDWLSSRYRFDIFDLSDTAMAEVVRLFSEKKFEYINGYTTVIVALAHYLRKSNLVLSQLCPTLKVCITTSEMLFESDKKLLEERLGVPVVNEYGASELDIIAFEDPEGRWLVNAENLFVEILDDQNQRVKDGIEGRIVVTALHNKAHPFIRYDVGDYGVLDPVSTAKKPILQRLTGRTNDFAILPSGKKPAGMTFYSITKALFDDNANVGEFVITQTMTDTFVIDYTSTVSLTAAETSHIEKVLSDYLEPGLTFVFNRHDALQRTKSGKLKQFTSLVTENPANR